MRNTERKTRERVEYKGWVMGRVQLGIAAEVADLESEI